VLRLLARALGVGAERGTRRHRRVSDRYRALFAQAFAIAGDASPAGTSTTRADSTFNVFAAWQQGVGRFDDCLGGLGGCPHAPGASGNVATEDVAYLFRSMGVETHLDFDRLIALRARLAHWLDGETLHGTLWRAGLPKTMAPGIPAAHA
jgi:hydroxymethylglutaryl-CoA lyase